MVNRLSYQLGLKAILPRSLRNEWLRSGGKSQVKTAVLSEKLWRAKVIMIRLTKLIRKDSLTLGDKCNITDKGLSLMWDYSKMYVISTIIINYYSNKEKKPQRSKIISIGRKGTMGNPKGRKPYGFGGFVVDVKSRREPGIRFLSSSSNIKPSGSVILKELREMNKVPMINTKIIHIIADVEILISAYENIKSSQGNMTPGGDCKTLDGIDICFIEDISSKLKAGKFNFTPARRVYIPKRDKDELRPLGVVSPRDKVVQHAMLMVLEAIFEPSFLDTSHGFRPRKGCHTALKKVKETFSNINWVIEGDISKCYDTINHQILLGFIRKRINCDKTLSLISKSLRNPYKDNGRLIYPKVGTFQGSPLSPLLCNIFLHEFDIFMEILKKSFYRGVYRRKNPMYRGVQHMLSYNKNLSSLEKRKLSSKLRALASKDFKDPDFRRLQYVRYADDFLVGIIGKREESVHIREEIKNFLFDTLLLNLNLDKTHITHFNKKGLIFLGTFIKGNQEKEKKVHLVTVGSKKLRVRSTSRARLDAPISTILKKGEENGFFRKTNTGIFVPKFCGRVINLEHADILRFYNQKIRGILNYFSFADNKKSLGTIIHGLKHSCALTLALKLKLKHRSKVFKRFGKTLKCPTTKVEIFIPKTFRRDQKFHINPEDPKSIMESRWANKFTRSNLYKSCLVCGKFPSEMHHLRHIKDLKSKRKSGKMDFWKTQLAAINRKQIPLCKEHHVNLHQNKLNTEERKKLIEAIKELK
jgi:group II intron reverse transcriptase/maturase